MQARSVQTPCHASFHDYCLPSIYQVKYDFVSVNDAVPLIITAHLILDILCKH